MKKQHKGIDITLSYEEYKDLQYIAEEFVAGNKDNSRMSKETERRLRLAREFDKGDI
jgi:hypothetical protein